MSEVNRVINLHTCNKCGKEFAADAEMAAQGPVSVLRLRHCEGGNAIDVPGKLLGFYEKVGRNLVGAQPVIDDPLED